MSRRIAITGATGFIGGMLARRLASADWQTRALVRRGSAHKQPAHIVTEWITGDLEDMQSLRHLVCGTDAVVHCAGVVRGADQAYFDRINVDGVARMVKAAAEQHPAPRFLLISSLAAREPHLSFYAASKRQGEKVLALNSGEMPWAILRPPAVYGPGDRELLPIFRWMARGIAPMIGSGNGRFSLLYVEDLADAITQWLERGNRGCGTFELHDGRNGGYSWHDIVDTMVGLKHAAILRARIPIFFVKLLARVNLMVARNVGRAPMLTPGKVRELIHPNWVCDNTEFSNHTGWAPRISLEEGLRRTLEWPDV